MGDGHITGRAAGIVALEENDTERVAAVEHAARCAACARELKGAVRMLALLDAMPCLPEPGAEAMSQVRARITADLDRARVASVRSPLIGLVAIWALCVILAKHHEPEWTSVASSVLLLGFSATCVAIAWRRPVIAVVLTLLASAAFASEGQRGQGLAGLLALKCLGV